MDALNKRLEEISQGKKYSLTPEIPHKNLLIEVTNQCNLNCIFCANSKMKRKRKQISPEIVIKILNEAHSLGIREVGFYTTGEALLNPNLKDYIQIAKLIGYQYVYLTTNGVLLNRDKMEEIVCAGIDSIKLSINAINQRDYQFIHGVDFFDQVLANLKNLFRYRTENDKKFKIFVSYIATRYTDYDVFEIKKFFKPYCDSVAVVNVRNQSGMMPEIIKSLSCKEESGKIPAARCVPCHYVFETLNVTSEGYLTACCTDFENYLAYADLNKESLQEAWTNSLITTLRQKHLEYDLEGTLCNNCIHNLLDSPTPLNRYFAEVENLNDALSDDKINKRLVKYKSML